MSELELDVHGLRVRAGGDWPEVLGALALDFAWFERPLGGGDATTLRIERRAPDWEAHAAARPAFVTPRNLVLVDGEQTLIDYFGRALSVYDRAAHHVTIQGEDAALVHEAAYHFVVSRIGEHLDRIGLVRLHALGLAGAAGGVAVMLPSGGGKSTLGLQALRAPGVRLLSDDSPLLDRRGRLHPFPLRIGVNATDAASLPAGHVRRIDRMEHHAKLALELSAFRDRIEPRPQPLRHLVLGQRTLGRGARLEPLGRRAALGPLLRESVVGVGLYQGMEFVLQRGLRDVFSQAGPGAVRARGCAAGLARAQVWRLTTGRDHEANWACAGAVAAVMYIWVRTSVDWDDEAAVLAQCPPYFRPKLERWNATFAMPFHVFRGRVRAIARDSLAAVEGATCAAWGDIPDGAAVLPVDDDDWFAPDAVAVLERLWDGSGGGCSWTSTFVEVPLNRRHAVGKVIRRRAPWVPLKPMWRCTTNNYALVKAPHARELATHHTYAGAWFERHDVPRLPVHVSAMNRTLASQTSLGYRGSALSRRALLRRRARYRRLYRSPGTTPDWCAPLIARMDALMAELEPR